MNELYNKNIDSTSFSYNNLLGVDRWLSFTPSFTSLTTVGALSTSGRMRIVGKWLQFQVTLSGATSIASTAGTTYMTLPVSAVGSTGMAVMTDDTAKTAVGLCHVDVTNSRCYLPSQAASGDSFHLSGNYEI